MTEQVNVSELSAPMETALRSASQAEQAPAPAPEVEQVTPNEGDDGSWIGDLYEDKDASPETKIQPDGLDEVPEEYDFKSISKTAANRDISQGDIQLATILAKELKLTRRQAARLISIGGDKLIEVRNQNRDRIVNEWRQEIENDPQLGMGNLNTTRGNLRRVMSRYATPEVVKLLQETRLGSHPGFVRMLNAIGRDLGEDQTFVQGEPAPVKRVDRLRSIYSKTKGLL